MIVETGTSPKRPRASTARRLNDRYEPPHTGIGRRRTIEDSCAPACVRRHDRYDAAVHASCRSPCCSVGTSIRQVTRAITDMQCHEHHWLLHRGPATGRKRSTWSMVRVTPAMTFLVSWYAAREKRARRRYVLTDSIFVTVVRRSLGTYKRVSEHHYRRHCGPPTRRNSPRPDHAHQDDAGRGASGPGAAVRLAAGRRDPRSA